MSSSTTEFFYFAVNSDFGCSSGKISPKKNGHLMKLISEFNISFILSCGNITQTGSSSELDTFLKNIYIPLERHGKEMFLSVGRQDVETVNYYFSFLRYVTSEQMWENICHYLPTEKSVLNWITKQYWGEKYSFLRGGIRFVSLGIYPSIEVSDWLQINVPNDSPLILFLQKDIEKECSDEEIKYVKNILEKRFDTLAIFNSENGDEKYKFGDIDVYPSGGTKFPIICVSKAKIINIEYI